MQNKKPPAHEVILALIRQLDEEYGRKGLGGDSALTRLRNTYQVNVLILVLVRMHIPQIDRACVVAELRRLPVGLIPPMDIDLYAEIEGATEE